MLFFRQEEEEEDEVEAQPSEEDTESDEPDTRLEKFHERLRNHDNILSTLKKGNYLLKSRVDKWQEELRKERSRYAALEIELNTCLAELGWTLKTTSQDEDYSTHKKKWKWKIRLYGRAEIEAG